MASNVRELAMFNLAIDSKLRACDLTRLQVRDVRHGSHVAARATVMQQKTQRPVQFEIMELTVEQARVMAQDWLAEVRRGSDPGGAKAEARKAPTMVELCKKFIEDYSKKRNKRWFQKEPKGC